MHTYSQKIVDAVRRYIAGPGRLYLSGFDGECLATEDDACQLLDADGLEGCTDLHIVTEIRLWDGWDDTCFHPWYYVWVDTNPGLGRESGYMDEGGELHADVYKATPLDKDVVQDVVKQLLLHEHVYSVRIILDTEVYEELADPEPDVHLSHEDRVTIVNALHTCMPTGGGSDIYTLVCKLVDMWPDARMSTGQMIRNACTCVENCMEAYCMDDRTVKELYTTLRGETNVHRKG